MSCDIKPMHYIVLTVAYIVITILVYRERIYLPFQTSKQT